MLSQAPPPRLSVLARGRRSELATRPYGAVGVLRSSRIVFVEDDEAVREAVAFWLFAAGFLVQVEADGNLSSKASARISSFSI
jgi:hypothetical protein